LLLDSFVALDLPLLDAVVGGLALILLPFDLRFFSSHLISSSSELSLLQLPVDEYEALLSVSVVDASLPEEEEERP
jgi:hypothetical protein